MVMFAPLYKVYKLLIIQLLRVQRSRSPPQICANKEDKVCQGVDDERFSRMLLVVAYEAKNDAQELVYKGLALIRRDIEL